MTRAPRVLVSGVALGQSHSGVRRHNDALLTRAADRLDADGGGLTILAGEAPLPTALATHSAIRTIESNVPAQPPSKRWWSERRAIRQAIENAQLAGTPFDLWHTGHLPVSRQPIANTLTIHDLRDLVPAQTSTPRRWVAPWVLAGAIRRARVVFTVSETVRSEIEQRFSPRRVVVIPNAGDHWKPLARAPEHARAGLLHVGHIEPRKNLERLVHALARAPDLPDLTLIGAPKRREDERLNNLARQLGVIDRVHILTSVSDEELARHYARAAAVVIPSSLEGFGIGVLEAQLARVPLAVSTAGALREVAGADVPSFAPSDTEGAVRAIRAALATTEATLERNAAHAQRFSWDASAALLVDAWA